VGPAKSEPDRLVGRGVGNGLVARIAIAPHDAAIAVEQLQRMDPTLCIIKNIA
jgi:hypothetical protein